MNLGLSSQFAPALAPSLQPGPCLASEYACDDYSTRQGRLFRDSDFVCNDDRRRATQLTSPSPAIIELFTQVCGYFPL